MHTQGAVQRPRVEKQGAAQRHVDIVRPEDFYRLERAAVTVELAQGIRFGRRRCLGDSEIKAVPVEVNWPSRAFSARYYATASTWLTAVS